MNRRVRFGLFDFDPDSGVLSREGVPVRLQPQPGRVLAVLVNHAGAVVTRDALRQEILSRHSSSRRLVFRRRAVHTG